MRRFHLGPFELSHENPPVFLAEIGGFFGQDYDLAREMILRIIAAGREVPQQPLILKTEILHDAEICLPGDTLETYSSKDGRVQQENYRALIERKVFPLEHYAKLFELCRAENTPFIVSVYDFAGADFAVQSGAAALKYRFRQSRPCAVDPTLREQGHSTAAGYRAFQYWRGSSCRCGCARGWLRGYRPATQPGWTPGLAQGPQFTDFADLQ